MILIPTKVQNLELDGILVNQISKYNKVIAITRKNNKRKYRKKYIKENNIPNVKI